MFFESVPSKLGFVLSGQINFFVKEQSHEYKINSLGLFLGGILADYVLEPFMATPSALQSVLGAFFGFGSGAGIAVMFFFLGILGTVISLTRLRKPIYKGLNEEKIE